METPHFFLDRSLGRIRVPEGLRNAGWSLTTLAEHYGMPIDQSVADVDWLELCGTKRWAILMKDDRIRRRPAEAAALVAANVPAFCIANANINTEGILRLLLGFEGDIMARCELAPTLYIITSGGLRTCSL